MRANALCHLLRRSPLGGSSRAIRGRSSRPLVELLEGRQLLAAVAISAVQQYGIPSVVAINETGNVSYNFLTETNGQIAWNGWVPIGGNVGAVAISTGSILVGATLRPDVLPLTSADNIYYNVGAGGADWNGWSPVGINVGQPRSRRGRFQS